MAPVTQFVFAETRKNRNVSPPGGMNASPTVFIVVVYNLDVQTPICHAAGTAGAWRHTAANNPEVSPVTRDPFRAPFCRGAFF